MSADPQENHNRKYALYYLSWYWTWGLWGHCCWQSLCAWGVQQIDPSCCVASTNEKGQMSKDKNKNSFSKQTPSVGNSLTHLERVGRQEVVPAEVLLSPGTTPFSFLPALARAHQMKTKSNHTTNRNVKSQGCSCFTLTALTIVRWSLLEFLDRALLLMSAIFSLPWKVKMH